MSSANTSFLLAIRNYFLDSGDSDDEGDSDSSGGDSSDGDDNDSLEGETATLEKGGSGLPTSDLLALSKGQLSSIRYLDICLEIV